MTKKEQKQMEIAKRDRVNLRYRLVDEYVNFNGDIEAYNRVYRINGETLTNDIKQKVLDRYPTLKEFGYSLPNNDMSYAINAAVYQIVQTERKLKCYNSSTKFERGISKDDVVYDETFPNVLRLSIMVMCARKTGYERIIYAKNSISAIADLVDMGCRVVESNRKNGEGGLTFDITSADLQMYACKVAEKEKNELIKHNAEWGRETPKEELDKIDSTYRELAELVKE